MVTTLTLRSRVRRIADRRAVLWRLIRADFSLKYEGSTLGYLWSILEPMLLTAVYFVIFTVIGLRTARVDPFALFLLSGILPWQWVTGTVSKSLRALRGNAKLIGKVALPREIFPLEVVCVQGLEFLLSWIVIIGLAAYYRFVPSLFLAALPLALLLQLTLLLGISLILSAANTLLRDIERVIKPLMRMAFYLSGILYPIHIVMQEVGSDSVLWLIWRLNPMIGILELHRAIWYPENFHGWTTVSFSAIGSVLLLVVGWVMFRRLEPQVLKEL